MLPAAPPPAASAFFTSFSWMARGQDLAGIHPSKPIQNIKLGMS